MGTVGLVDFDVVELSNLQRQILHHTPDVGRPKLESARDNIHAYNPDVNVVLHEVRLESDNAMDIISQYDLVVNGADNFATRYLVNDACYLLNKPTSLIIMCLLYRFTCSPNPAPSKRSGNRWKTPSRAC